MLSKTVWLTEQTGHELSPASYGGTTRRTQHAGLRPADYGGTAPHRGFSGILRARLSAAALLISGETSGSCYEHGPFCYVCAGL
jgi:hypothetical protein